MIEAWNERLEGGSTGYEALKQNFGRCKVPNWYLLPDEENLNEKKLEIRPLKRTKKHHGNLKITSVSSKTNRGEISRNDVTGIEPVS